MNRVIQRDSNPVSCTFQKINFGQQTFYDYGELFKN